jgi:photosystem II stability/assembly factor-like uncharacterized protein
LYKSTDGGRTWFDIGPEAPLHGSEPTAAIDPIEPSTIYLGWAKQGILFKSTNEGSDWQIKYLRKDSVESEIRCLAIDPSNPRVIYAGLNWQRNDIIWKSTDAGETWNVITSGIPKPDSTGIQRRQRVLAIQINPLNPSILYASVERGGVFRSDDGGEHWRIQTATYNAGDLQIVPWDTSIVLSGATGFEVDTTSKTIYKVSGKPLKSTDNGKSWVSLNNSELPDDFEDIYEYDIAVDPRNSNNLYLATNVGPYKSTDGGQSWQQSFDGLNDFLAYEIRIAPSNASVIYASGNGVHRSTNGGANWRYMGGVAYSPMAIDPVDPSVLYGSNPFSLVNHSIFRTIDGGRTWSVLRTISSATQIPFIEIDLSPQRAVYTSTSNQFLRSYDLGESWEEIPVPTIPRSLAIAPDNPDLLFIGTWEGVYKSTDRGQTWQLLGFADARRNVSILLDPKDSQTVYLRIDDLGFYKSTNGGEDWAEKNNGLMGRHWVAPTAINPTNPQEIFLATENGIFRTTDGGENWYPLSPAPPSDTVATMSIDANGGTLFIGSSHFTGVYKLDLVTSVAEGRDMQLPQSFSLSQSYPNPFNPVTSIEYSLPQASVVRLEIYDVLGRKARTLVNAQQSAGWHRMVWDGKNNAGKTAPSGVYICSLKVNDIIISRKMIFMQ